MPNNGSGAITFSHVTASGAGVKVNPATGADTFSHVTVAGTGRTGISQSGSGAVTLAHVTVTAAGQKWTGVGAITLQSIAVHGTLKDGITQSGTGALTLARVTAVGLGAAKVHVPGKVVCVSGGLTASGSSIFQFQGDPNLGVSWAITVGSGTLAPFSLMTDQYGRAWAKYTANGYSGKLTIGCTYVT